MQLFRLQKLYNPNRVRRFTSYATLVGTRGNGPAFGSVPKASWLGGVLYAHFDDARGPLEQSATMLAPWSRSASM